MPELPEVEVVRAGLEPAVSGARVLHVDVVDDRALTRHDGPAEDFADRLTGRTIAAAVQVVLNAGAKDVIVAATHGVLSDPAAQRLSECGAREVVVTDTLPMTPDKQFPQLTTLSIAPLLARAIREVFDDGSVTSLFDGEV